MNYIEEYCKKCEFYYETNGDKNICKNINNTQQLTLSNVDGFPSYGFCESKNGEGQCESFEKKEQQKDYRVQDIECCSFCKNSRMDNEVQLRCDILEEYVSYSGICNKYLCEEDCV